MKKMDQIIADYNSIQFESFMSEDEKWFFDTHGYIPVSYTHLTLPTNREV